MPDTPSTRGRATVRTPASGGSDDTWSPERTPDARPTTGASVTFGEPEQWGDYDTFSPESRPMTGVSRPTTGKSRPWTGGSEMTRMSSRAMTPHTPGHLSRKDSGWTARTTGTAHTTATHTSDYSAWGMYSEGFAESEPPESWRDKVLEAWRIPPLWSTQMRSDTYKHLEDCTLLRVNAQTAREGPYRHRISIEEADDVWAPHLYLYVFPAHPEVRVPRPCASRRWREVLLVSPTPSSRNASMAWRPNSVLHTRTRAIEQRTDPSQNAGLRRQGHRAALRARSRGRTASI